MAKLTLTNLATLNDVNTQNENNDLIETALENTLSRDGTAPNYMDAVLDMNDNRIINVPYPVNATDAVNKQYVDDEIAAIPVGGGSGGTSDHGLLNGLGDDDHPQYPNIADDTEIITGNWTFSNRGLYAVDPTGTSITYAYLAASSPTTALIEVECDAGASTANCYSALAQYGGNGNENRPFYLLSRYSAAYGKPTAGENIGSIIWETSLNVGNGAGASVELACIYQGDGVNSRAASDLELRLQNDTAWMFDSDGGFVGYVSGIAATGGSQGPGTINCKGIYVDGVAVSGGGGSVAALGDIGDVTISAVATGEILMRSGSLWINRTLAEAGVAAASHNHSATQITSGTMATARLGSGTASTSTFLRGDSTWAAPTFTPTFSGVRVYRNANLVCTNNAYTAVPWSVENYDSDSYWSGGSNISVPDDGYYHIDAGIRWDTATSGQRAIRITANSVNVAEATVTPTGSINTHIAVSCDVYLTAGQTITIYAGLFNGSGDRSLAISGQTTFCNVHKIA